MALGGFPLGGDALGGAGSVLYTLDTTAGAFTLTGYPVKPHVLGATRATYAWTGYNPSIYKRVTISNGYKDTFDTGLVKTTLPITAGALALNSNPVSAVYTQFVPQPVFPFWSFYAGSWQTVLFAYLIWVQWQWVNGVHLRSIIYNVGPGQLTISGKNAWLDHVSSKQRFTQVSAEVFYVPFPSHRLTTLAVEVLYAPHPAQRLTTLAVEVLYSNITHGIQTVPAHFTISASPITFVRNRTLNATAGALSLSGSDATLAKVIYKDLFASGGSFAISGQATLVTNRLLSVAPGALTLAGNDAGSLRNRVLTAQFGQFNLAGQGATLNATGHLNGVTAAFVLSGKPVALKVNKVLNAAAGALSLAANDTTLAHKYRLQVQAAAYTIALFDLQIGSVKVLNGLTGSYALSAASASLLKTQIWDIGTGSFTISGNAADRMRKRILFTLPGNYALAPKTINPFFWARIMQLGTGALTISGVDIQEWRAFPIGLLLDPGALTISGNAATFATGRVLNAAAGAVAISAPTILYPKRTLLAQAANFNMHGGAPQQQLRPRAGSIAITSAGATLNRTQTLLAAADAFTIAGNDLGGGLVRLLSAQKGAFVLAGKPVVLSHPRILYTAAGALLLNASDTTHALTRKITARPAAFGINSRPIGFTTVNAISAQAAAFLIEGVTIWPDKEAKAVFTVTKVMNVEMGITHRAYVEGSVTARMGVIGGVSEPQASFTVRPANP